MKAVVVLSGGQDSALCLKLAVDRFGSDEVAAITFRYSQRHAVEVNYARRLAKKFAVAKHNIVTLDFYKSLTSSALLTKTSKIKNGVKCPNTVVEGRNALFLMTASIWAKSLGAKMVYTGVSQSDFSGYPDCREVFIKAQEKSIRLALDYPVKIVTPFMHKTKAEEWALAARLGVFDVIANETVTCYNGIPGAGCGKCPACRLRAIGLKTYLKKYGRN